ncbi:hypothetical protein, partial [Streptomyces sp. NPDC093589]|uniref:hypothetical protein n=1 Tax=Streptomyces sp. NPDC093589 TaxID=3366043 RepID=UPI0038299203
ASPNSAPGKGEPHHRLTPRNRRLVRHAHREEHFHDHFDALGRALADVFNHRGLHGGWSHEAGWNVFGAVSLFHPDGLGFSLCRWNTHRKGPAGRRLTINGIYPGCWGGARAADITVDKDRRVTEIADEIERRLLPDYLPTLQEAWAEKRIAEKHSRARVFMNQRLEAAVPGLSAAGAPRHPEPDRTRSYWYDRQESPEGGPAVLASGSVFLSRDATHATLKLNDVPAEVALKILSLLAPRPALEGCVHQALPAQSKALPAVGRIVLGEVLGDVADVAPARPKELH